MTTNSSNASNSLDENVSNLVAMGFEEDRARAVLQLSNNNLEMALNHLLGLGLLAATESSRSATVNSARAEARSQPNEGGIKQIHCAFSQFDVPTTNSGVAVGRSACSCIALYGAFSFFADAANATCNLEKYITPVFIQNCILTGIDIYSECRSRTRELQLQSTSHEDGILEHFSPERVMELASLFSTSLEQIGDIRQGVLDVEQIDSRSNPLGFHAQLEACRSDSQAKANKWMAVVITKTPETVLVLLPPTASSSFDPKYVLIDSHPRS